MSKANNYFSNQFLIAMPMLTDPYFARGVAYICEHNKNGAIGLVINHPLDISLHEVFKQMSIADSEFDISKSSVLCGGPVHPERGFVIHSPAGKWRSSLEMSSEIWVTTSRDILQAIAENQGPKHSLITLGYASWGAGQLEQEIMNNYWLISPVDLKILFQLPFPDRWEAAIKLVGIDLDKLSRDVGHA